MRTIQASGATTNASIARIAGASRAVAFPLPPRGGGPGRGPVALRIFLPPPLAGEVGAAERSEAATGGGLCEHGRRSCRRRRVPPPAPLRFAQRRHLPRKRGRERKTLAHRIGARWAGSMRANTVSPTAKRLPLCAASSAPPASAIRYLTDAPRYSAKAMRA